MSSQIIKILITAALGAHAVAHAVALWWLVVQAATGSAASRMTVSPWALNLDAASAGAVASIFWVLAALGFVGAALSLWGVFVPASAWRQLAVAASLVSTLGVVFTGAWPGSPSPGMSVFHVGIALTMNLAVLASLLGLHWPSQAALGN